MPTTSTERSWAQSPGSSTSPRPPSCWRRPARGSRGGCARSPRRGSRSGAPAVPDGPRLEAALRAVGGEGCYLYSLDPVDSHSTAYARFFNPTVGIAEDPATGTAAGPLASHLVAHGLIVDGSTVVIEQGHRIGRPSRIEIGILGERVTITGACVIVAEGTLHH